MQESLFIIIIWTTLLQKVVLLSEVSQPQAGKQNTHMCMPQNSYIHIPLNSKPCKKSKTAPTDSILFQRRLTVTRPCYDLNWLSQFKIPNKLSLHPRLTAAMMMDRKAVSLNSSAAKLSNCLCCFGCTRAHNIRYSPWRWSKSHLTNTNTSSAFAQ